MSGKHLCQLRFGEKAALLHELRDVVHRLDAVEHAPSPLMKYDVNYLPNFLREKVPKFKKNLDLQPLITHTSADEVRFTSGVKVANAGGEDPHTTYALIPGPGNPFKPTFTTSDGLCKDFCDKTAAAERLKFGKKPFVHEGGGPQPVCLRQFPNDPPRDPRGNIYDCDHNRKMEGIMVCNPKGGQQAYLCIKHNHTNQEQSN